ncbi:MAG: hypothetical protein JWP25_8310 [Bradyrhizobium sp.]|nr:hypothetical protein [Bradyrhizobium sp.]
MTQFAVVKPLPMDMGVFVPALGKGNLQVSAATDPETLPSQIRQRTQNRISINALAVVHGRLIIIGSRPNFPA